MALEDDLLKDDLLDENGFVKLMEELDIAEDMDLNSILAEEDDSDSEGISFDVIPEDEEIEVPDFETEEEIPTEEFVDMDEIDAILSDVSEIHPDRNVSAEFLQERIDKYAENPEEAERLLANDEEENNQGELTDSSEDNQEADSDDFLANLENVEEMLANVEKQANEEANAIQNEISSDSDLDEINDLISKSENNEAINDDLLRMIDGLDVPEDEDEINPEEKEVPEETKGKKKKKDKKKKKKADESAENIDETAEETPKKPGLFAKIFGFMTEEDTDEEEAMEGEAKEGEAEEGKKKKDKKGKKDKKAAGKDNASIEAELDEEDKKDKKKKEKKEKKPKKKKDKPKKVEEVEDTKSHIKTGGVIFTFLFCVTILGLVFILCVGGTRVIAKSQARIAYYRGDYETASNKLYGLRMSKSDELIFKKASLLYRFDLINDKIEAYKLMGDERKLCDAMFEYRKECDKVYVDAKLLSITDEIDVRKNEIDLALKEKYGISPSDIDAICNAKRVYYTVAVDNLLAGEPYYKGAEKAFDVDVNVYETVEEVIEEEEPLEDMLPEEAEIQ